ncbi:MAG: TetR/AcrR family transcriptional regulator [Gammaproteobacteria bacterium]|nr:TetR/AcrR family transcriptional regulator [Gammaproteobacteria bacterium]
MKAPLDTRERILSTARELFHANSYSDIGIKQICDTARVQKGSFYHFFPSKRDLALAVIEDMAEEWAQGFVKEAFDQTLPPMERLDYLIDAAYYWQKAAKDIEGRMPGCLFGNLVLEVSTRDDILRAKLSAVLDKTKSRFEETLIDGVAAGAMAPLDTDLTAQAMLAYLEGMILLAKSRNEPELIAKLGPALKGIRIELCH